MSEGQTNLAFNAPPEGDSTPPPSYKDIFTKEDDVAVSIDDAKQASKELEANSVDLGGAEGRDDDDDSHDDDRIRDDEIDEIVKQNAYFSPWEESSTGSKVGRVIFYVASPFIVVGTLYFFICSLDILTSAFRLLAGRTAGELFANSVLLNNPVSGLMIGVVVTVLVQSSSTSSSITISLVAASIVTVRQAIPIIMGANIGTTVTSVLVSLTQSSNKANFKRSFSGATMHDMFNWCCVIILLPIEAASGYLFRLTELMTRRIGNPNSTAENVDFLKVLTTPLTNKIVRVNTGTITAVAVGDPTSKYPMIRNYCPLITKDFSVLFSPEGEYNKTFYDIIDARPYTIKLSLDLNGTLNENFTTFSWNDVNETSSSKCDHLFVGQGMPDSSLTEVEVGVILLFSALLVLIACLIILVKTLSILMRGPLARTVRRWINADFPGYAAFLTGYVAILAGGGLTILVQSSSVFMSTLTPLVGVGLIELKRMYPLALGANLGTTVTGILAALTAESHIIRNTMQIAFCHLFFNITGIILFYPIPLMRKIPMGMAKFLGRRTGEYRWFAIIYVIFMFFLFPLLIFGLSLAGWYVLLGVAVPVVLIILAIIAINLIQSYRRHWLPRVLHTWDFLPAPLRSLEPYDRLFIACCNRKCCKSEGEPDSSARESTDRIVEMLSSRKNDVSSTTKL